MKLHICYYILSQGDARLQDSYQICVQYTSGCKETAAACTQLLMAAVTSRPPIPCQSSVLLPELRIRTNGMVVPLRKLQPFFLISKQQIRFIPTKFSGVQICMYTTSPDPPLCKAKAEICGAPPKRYTSLFQFGYTTYSGGSIKETNRSSLEQIQSL